MMRSRDYHGAALEMVRVDHLVCVAKPDNSHKSMCELNTLLKRLC